MSYGQESALSRRRNRQIIDNAYFTAIIFKTKEMSPTSAAGLIALALCYLLTILIIQDSHMLSGNSFF